MTVATMMMATVPTMQDPGPNVSTVRAPNGKPPARVKRSKTIPTGRRPVVGGNQFVVVQADGDDSVHSDAKTANKAVELIRKHADGRFWLGVGFVRPHVPFVAPRPYFEPFKPFDELILPPKVEGDWNDIPKLGINYKTSFNMKMDEQQQRKAIGGYYASVGFIDAQVGKVLNALREAGLENKTIVIFTSDHGYHLGEHDFWAKVSLHEPSAAVPLIVRVPGKPPAVCHSLVELLDLYPTTAALCGLGVPKGLQGLDISPMFDNPSRKIRDSAFSVAPNRNGFLIREDRWAYLQYAEDGSGGCELYDMHADPRQYNNLAGLPSHADQVARLRGKLRVKLAEVRPNDLQ